METKSKAQAKAGLLAAIDSYIDTVITEKEQERKLNREARLRKYIEDHKNDTLHIPDDARGPYAQYLRNAPK